MMLVVGMIAHGHGDLRYTQYGLDIFLHDLNYTVGSLAKLLQDLKLPPKYSSQELFGGSGSSPLFRVILQGAEICKSSLPPTSKVAIVATPIPPIFNI